MGVRSQSRTFAGERDDHFHGGGELSELNGQSRKTAASGGGDVPEDRPKMQNGDTLWEGYRRRDFARPAPVRRRGVGAPVQGALVPSRP